MSTADAATHDYTTGVPRHHHSLYLEDGNFVMRVENAIFNVHRSVLARYSNVIKDMLDVPQGSQFAEGTDEHPLVLTSDSVAGWELLLGTQYNGPRFFSEAFNGDDLMAILPVAHKYCIDTIEEDIVRQLKLGSTTAAYVDLMVAAQITGSEPLYQQVLKALTSSMPRPDLAQARRIGVDAHYAITVATILNNDSALADARAKLTTAEGNRGRECRSCGGGCRWYCSSCGFQ